MPNKRAQFFCFTSSPVPFGIYRNRALLQLSEIGMVMNNEASEPAGLVQFQIGWLQVRRHLSDFSKRPRVEGLLQGYQLKIFSRVKNAEGLNESRKRIRPDYSDDGLGFGVVREPRRVAPRIELAISGPDLSLFHAARIYAFFQLALQTNSLATVITITSAQCNG